MNRIRSFGLGLVLVSFVIEISSARAGDGVARVQDAVPPANDDQTLRKLIGVYQSAYNSEDANAAAGIFAEKAEWRIGSHVFASGRKAIERTLREVFVRPQSRNSKLEFVTESVDFVEPNVALVSGYYEVTRDAKIVDGKRKYSSVFVKEKDAWLCGYIFEYPNDAIPLSSSTQSVPTQNTGRLFFSIINAFLLGGGLVFLVMQKKG